MEFFGDIIFLNKPNIRFEKLDYILNATIINANLYQIELKKELKFYKYPFFISPSIEDGDINIRKKLFKYSFKNIKLIYGECLISGNSFYSMKRIDDMHSIVCKLYLNRVTEYNFEIYRYTNVRTIKQEDIQKDPLSKQLIEMAVRDILNSNPKLECYKDVFFLKNDKKRIETDNISVNFFQGFSTSFIETESGNYINIILKNKINRNDTILDYLNQYKNKNSEDIRNEIKKELIGQSFKVPYAKRNYKIDDILFDRNPKNQSINYDCKTINLIEYFNVAHNLIIREINQPIILVKKLDSQGKSNNIYFIPEYCRLTGLPEEATKDKYLMKELEKYTKLQSKELKDKANKFISLFYDCDKSHGKLSPKEKSELYGISIKQNQGFTAYYMKDTKLIGGNKNEVNPRNTFPLLEKIDFIKWLFFYEQKDYSLAKELYSKLSKASKGYNLIIQEPTWIEMPNHSKAKDWTDIVDDYFEGGESKYSFVIFLIDDKNNIYPEIKKHSLCKNTYVSQVIKTNRFRRNIMKICSKILLQINTKLGGISYKIDFGKIIKDRKIMVIGVDSSHIKGKRTGVAMVATINESFTDFFNREEIIEEENKQQLSFCISIFIEQAISVYYKKNNNYPKRIIIYRQGVSLQQKDLLKKEIQKIKIICGFKKLLYYYIIVNSKINFKFYNKYGNEKNNLLVGNGITNRNFFEFYIQPQEVTEGIATPTCFHVAHGNLHIEEMIPKFTFDLCHIYSNWEGSIRIPNVIKNAEKLSKMAAECKFDKLNKNLEFGQAYL